LSDISASQYSVNTLFTLSERIYKAEKPEALIDAVQDTLQIDDVYSVNLQYVDSDAEGKPESLVMVGSRYADNNKPPVMPPGMRFAIANHPFTQLWVKNPNRVTLVSDVETSDLMDDTSKQVLSRTATKALATLPLVVEGEWVGLINIVWSHTRAFDAQAERFYEAVAGLLAGRVATFRTMEKLHAQIAENELIAAVVASLSRATDEATILQALTPFAERYAADRMSLSYFHVDQLDQPDEFEMVASKNVTTAEGLISVEGVQGLRFKTELFGMLKPMMANSDMPNIVEDVAADTDLDDSTRQIALYQGIKAAVTIALKIADRWLGVVTLQWAAPTHFDSNLKPIIAVLRPSVEAAVLSRRNLLEANERREQAEKLAQATESRLQLFIRNAPVIMFALDKNGIFTFSDGAGLKPLGLQPGQVVGLSAFDVYSDNPLIVESLKKALAGQEVTVTNFVGELAYQNVNTPFRDENGEVAGVIGIAIDISERQKAERERNNLLDELRESSQRLDIALEGANLGVWDWNMLTNEVVYSDQWARILGYEPEELRAFSNSSGLLIHPGDLARVADHTTACLSGSIPAYGIDLRFKTKSGEYKWVLASGRVVERLPDGRPSKLIGIQFDINDRKLADQERERLIRELRETARFKDEFLATMSHELRTPLNAMIGLLGIVLMGNRVADTDKNMIVRARANSERLLNLINNILDISRMEAGRLEIVPSNVDMRSMVAKVERDLAVLAEQKKLALRIEIDPEMPTTLRVDEDAVNKILINLVGNAVKFTKKGHVIVRIAQREDALRIEVQDSGIGIPVHQREIIFDSFRQADGSTTRQYGGSGLGLSIVRNLCRAMDGSIRVESEVGIGSTFLVSLPLEKHLAPELAVAG